MKEIGINDEEAVRLLEMLKSIIEPVDGVLKYGDKGNVHIESDTYEKFLLTYFYGINKKTFNFRELRYNYSLVRINISNGFHKNADGSKIIGNRINIFSEDEYYLKGDGTTHMRAYPLPYENIESVDDFIALLKELFTFTNTNFNKKINLSIQLDLDTL